MFYLKPLPMLTIFYKIHNMDFLSIFLLLFSIVHCEDLASTNSDLYTVEGRVFPPDSFAQGPLGNWQINTRVLANGGEYVGFLKSDGGFVISNVPSGSYVIEVVHPDYAYEPVRVEINSKGKFRARKVNHIQTSQVIPVPYPLKMKAFARFRYFMNREQWRIVDFVMSPMVLMMVLPLVLIMILPKMMNDPETRKELDQLNSSMKFEMPEFSEIMSKMCTDEPKPKSVKGSKKKQQ